MSDQTTSEEKLSLMSSLSRTWSSLSNLPEDRFVDRWDALQLEVEGSNNEVERIAYNVQHLGDPVTDKSQASTEIQGASVKLSDHIIRGTDVTGRIMGAPAADGQDAAIAQEWTEAVRFVDDFCQDNQKRIHAISQSQTKNDEPESNYYLGLASGSLSTAAQVARQQYERGVRMSLQGPLAAYAAASALENGLTTPPDGPVYGTYRAIHEQTVLVEGIPGGQLLAVPVDAEAAKALQIEDTDLRGKPVVFAYENRGQYARREPEDFAAKYRERATQYYQEAGYQDGEGYHQYLDEAARLFDFAHRITPVSPSPAPPVATQNNAERLPPVRTREEIINAALDKMRQAFSGPKTDVDPTIQEDAPPAPPAPPGTSGVAFHLDEQGAVIWDTAREEVHLASAGYSVLPVLYGFGAKLEICRQGEIPLKLLVEHEGKTMATFPVEDMSAAMAYVEKAKAGIEIDSSTTDYRGGPAELDHMSRVQKLEHAFHLGLLERLDSPDVSGPEVYDARNDGLPTTVRAIVRDANQNAYALVEADAVDYRQADQSTATHRLFAVPVADSDADKLVVDEPASFLVLDWRDHCTVVEYPAAPEAANQQAEVPKTSEVRHVVGAEPGF